MITMRYAIGRPIWPRPFCRIGFYFTVHRRNVTAEDVKAYLRQVYRSLRRPLIVIMDRWSAHRKADKELQDDTRFDIEWLPAYAPELNPTEYTWGNTKYGDLANYVPDDVDELQCELEVSFVQTRQRPELLESFFHAAELEIE